MTYTKLEQADAALAAWVEHSEAPALAIVKDSTSYRVVEADADGVFIIRCDEQVIDTMWTRHRAGVNDWMVMNAYSVACCYHQTYVKELALRAPHGTAALGPFLDQAVTDAHESEFWRSLSECGETFVGEISEGEGVCPWMGGLPVPDAWSEKGERPVVVFKTVGGKFEKIVVTHGEAHVLVVNEDDEEFDRWSFSEHQGRIDAAKQLAIEYEGAVDLLHEIFTEIKTFDRNCEAASYTDTGDVWTLLDSIRKRIVEIVGNPCRSRSTHEQSIKIDHGRELADAASLYGRFRIRSCWAMSLRLERPFFPTWDITQHQPLEKQGFRARNLA